MSHPHAHPPSGNPLHELHLARASLLPDRAVTHATIEDAYVRFIFYCNPALPRSADTQTLREAFRNPPRSGGKLFSPYVIFELVTKFYTKEIKTWTELTTRLGVEPPDPGKDESTQKIAQYGVRLKKWMNSMHIKAFFEYLMGIPNDYWTRIPEDPDPIALPIRDGIAVEDDMALRALLPHIRPKRGRKRPEEDIETTPIQSNTRQGFPPPGAGESLRPWPTPSESRAPPMPVDPARPGIVENVWEHDMREPLQSFADQWPNPAVGSRPEHAGADGSSFWDEPLESLPSSATSTRPKAPNIRRGAKNVSSAWKTTGAEPGSSKTRGRPPINPRPGDEVPGGAHPAWSALQSTGADASHSQRAPAGVGPLSTYSQSMSPPPPPASHQSSIGAGHVSTREAESSARYRMSSQMNKSQIDDFQQPQPPPTLSSPLQTQDGELGHGSSPHQPSADRPPSRMTNATPASIATASGSETSIVRNRSPIRAQPVQAGREVPMWYFEHLEDRTNVDALISYFTHVLHNADWIDANGNIQERAGLAESSAMVNVTLEQMFKSADSTQAFLINLAALAGARMLMAARPRCFRKLVSNDIYEYNFNWKYCFGHLNGHFTITNQVPIAMWRKASEQDEPPPDVSAGATAAMETLTVEEWQAKYKTLMEELEKRDREILDMQDRVLGSL